MTPEQFKSIRHALGLSAQGMANALGLTSGRAVRYYESGGRPIIGPVLRLMQIYNKHPKLAKCT